jgi:hypothetical protein
MNSPINLRVLNVAVFIVALIGAFIGLVKYSMSAGPRMSWDSKLVLNEFYVRSQSRNYAGAYQLTSQNLKSSLSLQSLTQQWQAFEKAHGPIRNWSSLPGGSDNLFPKYVESVYAVTGKKKGAGTVWVRMIPENGSWRVDRIVIQP